MNTVSIGDTNYVLDSANIEVAGIKNPVGVRPNTTDVFMFDEIFIRRDYTLPFDLPSQPNVIIDGGANVGYASVWFANLFPNTTTVAIEPDIENYSLMHRNLCPYENVHPLRAALWHEDTYLNVLRDKPSEGALRHSSIQVADNGSTGQDSVYAISINTIMSEMQLEHIDILKVDIEGSEKELFSRNFSGWVDKTNLIIVETHDRMKKGCSSAVNCALSADDFKRYRVGENDIFARKSWLT